MSTARTSSATRRSRCSSVAFVVAVVAAQLWLRGVRVDLTENNLYTLGEGTQDVLDGIEEPINLYFFSRQGRAAARTCARTPLASARCSRNSRASARASSC